MREFMTTAEVADYLRLKERKIYELVRLRRIPCSHVTGKLLFPKQAIDLWLAAQTEFDSPELRAPPPVAAGSHDLLLEWALRESGCELALLSGGSEDGLKRLAEGQAIIAGLHILDPESGGYNIAALRSLHRMADMVLIEWATRQQGLIVAPGNPLGVECVRDLSTKRLRVIRRQDGAGAHILLRYLLSREGLRLEDLDLLETPARTETDLAAVIFEGKADCGVGIEAVAKRFRLGFIPVHRERFDLAMRRRDYFEPPVQTLLRFGASAAFRAEAAALSGYEIGDLGRVVYNP
jgi:putative molybdopterin biosynthesis protein